MSVIRFDRFQTDPAQAEELITRRNALVDAVRQATPGLVQARLTRLDERTWIDMWHWESRARAQAAAELAQAGRIPEAKHAFALTTDVTTEFTEIVDER